MVNGPLIEEFATIAKSDLQKRLVNIFREYFAESDEEIISHLKSELESILREKIGALSSD